MLSRLNAASGVLVIGCWLSATGCDKSAEQQADLDRVSTRVRVDGLRRTVGTLLSAAREYQRIVQQCRERHPKGSLPYDQKFREQLANADSLRNPLLLRISQLESHGTDPKLLGSLDRSTIALLGQYVTLVAAFMDSLKRLDDLMVAKISGLRSSPTWREDRVSPTYGVVLLRDKGGYFTGAAVRIGQPVCRDLKAGKCTATNIDGFEIEIGGKWFKHPGKPRAKGKLADVLADIVIPIAPTAELRLVEANDPIRAYQETLSALEQSLARQIDVGQWIRRRLP